MKNIITLSIVALILSIFSAQYAMANNLALDETLGTAVEATANEAKAEAAAAANDIKVNGGYVRIGRDGSVSVVSNGPTIGQRIYLAGAEVKKGVLYVTYKTYEGAKAADGAVVGTVTYPFGVIADWMKDKPETKEVAVVTPAPAAAPATK
jgi:hypothetical protein